MSAILTVKGLAAGHADRLLFSGLDLVIAPGEITGLVGANGAGKSTLLRILAGLVRPDQGEVGLSPPAATVGYLSQEPERRPGESTGGFIARRTGVARAQQDLDEATALLVQEKPGADDAYATALERWLALGGADLEERAAAVFTTLGLPADAGGEAMTSLSGGQAARKLAGKVKATERMLDRLDVVAEPRKEWQLKMEIAAAPRSGTVAAALRDAVIERGGFRLGPVSLQVNWADRIAITGPNGAGKSTLIGALLGRLPLMSTTASHAAATGGSRSSRGSPAGRAGPKRCLLVRRQAPRDDTPVSDLRDLLDARIEVSWRGPPSWG